MNLKNYIREINDFPKPSIVFKDITPLLNHPEAMRFCLNTLTNALDGQRIDKVVGVESRGFFFATLLAQKLNAGFVPVRKPNKLPFDKLTASYDLEYGTDTLEIHSDAILPGENVLIHDDVLATGGTMEAVTKLVSQLGGNIVQCNFIIEISSLNGRERINSYDIFSAMEY